MGIKTIEKILEYNNKLNLNSSENNALDTPYISTQKEQKQAKEGAKFGEYSVT